MNLKEFLLALSFNIVWCYENIGQGDDIPDGILESLPCQLSETKASTPGFICKGQLLFEDNFDSTIQQGEIWTPEIKIPGEPDFPFNTYLNGNHINVNSGSLNIKPVLLESIYENGAVLKKLDLKEKCTGMFERNECFREASGPHIVPPIVTGKITTKKSFAFKYGRIEVSAKMPEGSWIVPEIQLEPRDHVYGTLNYASGILRVACVKGNLMHSKKLYGGPILSGAEPLRSEHLRNTTGVTRWSQKYHTYSLEWRPDVIRLFVDGKQYGEVVPNPTFADGVNVSELPAAALWMKGNLLAPFDEMVDLGVFHLSGILLCIPCVLLHFMSIVGAVPEIQFYISLGMTIGGVNEFPDEDSKPWVNQATKATLNFWKSRTEWLQSWADDSALHIDSVKVYAL